jgi:hypothetical protein
MIWIRYSVCMQEAMGVDKKDRHAFLGAGTLPRLADAMEGNYRT